MFTLRFGRAGLLGTPFSLLVSPAIAQETGGEEQLRILGKCRGSAFEGLNLSGRKLTASDLSESTIRDVDFSEARLNIALFDDATAEAADLTAASRVICGEPR
jgi:uncharacterized protein YjbI with pentapeptide repeats